MLTMTANNYWGFPQQKLIKVIYTLCAKIAFLTNTTCVDRI